jgi:hypothetical protein
MTPKIVWLSASIAASVGCYYAIPSMETKLKKSYYSNNYGCRGTARRFASLPADHRHFPTCPYGHPGRKWKTLAPAKGFTKS